MRSNGFDRRTAPRHGRTAGLALAWPSSRNSPSFMAVKWVSEAKASAVARSLRLPCPARLGNRSILGQTSWRESESPLPSLSGVSVLAVDDNEEALVLVAATLARAGARVDTANSAQQALAIWRRQPADVLLCDLAMPGRAGSNCSRSSAMPTPAPDGPSRAVALSAYASEDDQARTLAAGFGAHVTKPFAQDTLIRAVASVASAS